MQLNDYQESAFKTAVYPSDKGTEYTAIGLAGEVGEYCNKVKKILRGDELIDDIHPMLAKELGDILWYVAACAYELRYSLEEIAQLNLAKLRSRAEREAIKGSGDER